MLTFITQILIASTAILLLSVVGKFLLRRKSTALRHAWLCSVMIGLLVLPLMVPFLPVFSPVKTTVTTTETTVESSSATQTIAEPTFAVMEPVTTVAVSLQENHFANETPALAVQNQPLPITTPENTRKIDMAVIIAVVLCAAMAIRLIMLLASIAATRRVAKNALVFKTESNTLSLMEIRKRFRVRQHVTVLTYDQVEIPFAAGIIKPVIFLPTAMQGENPEKLRLVLMHEMAHIARHDVFWQLLSRLMLALYWFHPLAWWLAGRIRQEREFACDDAVLLANDRATDTAEDYAMVLLDIAESIRRKSVFLPGCTVAMAQTHQIENRIRAILDPNRVRKPVGRLSALLLVLCVCGLTAFAGMFSPFEVEVEAKVEGKTTATETQVEETAQETNNQFEVPDSSEIDALLSKAMVDDRPQYEKTVRITGRVFMPDGTPAKNVTLSSSCVAFFKDSANGLLLSHNPGSYGTTSDSEGNFSIMTFSGFNTVISAYMKDKNDMLLPWISRPIVICCGEKGSELDITLCEGVPVTGTTRFEDGSPAAGIGLNVNSTLEPVVDSQYEMVRKHTKFSHYGKSGEQGNYRLYLPPGEYEIFAHHQVDGSHPVRKITIDQTADQGKIKEDFTIEKVMYVYLERMNGRPVYEDMSHLYTGGNFICWSQINAGENEIPYMAWSTGYEINSEGNIRLFPKDLNNYILLVTEDGQEAIACNLPGNLNNATVVTKTLVPAVKVRFRMLDMATKKPIANQKIDGPVNMLTPNSRSPVNHRFYLSYTSDENGEVVAAAAPLGEYEELEYNLQILYDSEREAKTIQGNTKFSPRKAGETINLGDILVENGIAAPK